MAQNHIQRGKTIDTVAPTGGLVSGQAFLMGTILGVALGDAAETEPVRAAVGDVWELPKTLANTPSVGQNLYWNSTTNELTTAATGNTLVGKCWEDAGATDATVKIRLPY